MTDDTQTADETADAPSRSDAVHQLIASLSSGLAPVTPLAPLRRRAVTAIGVALVAALAAIVSIGVRHDWRRAVASPPFVAEQLILAGVMAAAAWSAIASSVPGAASSRSSRWAIAGWLAWPLVAGVAWRAGGGTVVGLSHESLHPFCGLIVAAAATIPLAALAIMTSRGFVLLPGHAAVSAAVAASALGAFAVQWICPIAKPAHALVSHAVPAAGVAMVAAAVMLLVLRSSSRSRPA